MTEAFWHALDATWPAAAEARIGPWIIRNGRGGGKRVSSATALGPVGKTDIAEAQSAMRALGQVPLFRIRDVEEDAELDLLLAESGYAVVDPVVAYRAALGSLSLPSLPPLSAFAHWPPLAICTAIWAEGGIEGERLRIMDRAPLPKAVLLARAEDRSVGAAFVAVSGRTAALHAVMVRPCFRRKGYGRVLLHAACDWALTQGANDLVLLVTAANLPARTLYASFGLQVVGQYHYREATSLQARQNG
jgi:GNAT superfamily N-acetyltransferase